MSENAQALADALAGRIRVRIREGDYSKAHALNVLQKAGVPIDWRQGTHGKRLAVLEGKLIVDRDYMEDCFVCLWIPPPPITLATLRKAVNTLKDNAILVSL